MIFFKIVYYLFSLPVFLHEHNRLISGKQYVVQLKTDIELLKEMTDKNGSPKAMSKIEKSIAMSVAYKVLFQLGYILWVIIGLMSFNWWIFTIILLMSRIPKKNSTMVRLDAIITICFVTFVILNTSIYKIDATFYIKSWFNLL